ncbi:MULTISPECIES: hypothetical protein [unclassified Parafrankia]|uniref:hypothetical protein n=1 Tax=unclassified Parafrankia TaxID=2994368 RepID=UPI000DA4C423|nr:MULTISPECIES: hypothetical protein [unclassified Parafrankia]TCJ34921.1 hypothetical protein E0504_30685 [Parafrankia sp. BMG5.11]SQE00387.1 conserved hypothetical protein [Parafrankia sp. Ea1.12]
MDGIHSLVTKGARVTIIGDDVEIVLNYGQPVSWFVPARVTSQQIQDREHTNMFLAELLPRYPAGPPANLINPSIAAINAHPRITPSVVRIEISNEEAALAIPNTAPAAAPVAAVAAGAPAGARRAALRARMQARRGAYTWREGRSVAFNAWINGAAPLANPIGDNATINCWEAVLVAAAEAGLVTVAQLTHAYGAVDPDTAVYNLLTAGGVQQINCANAAPANNIQAGDVIMVEHAGQPLHHVMVVLTADPANFLQIEVLSLWGTLGGFVLGRGELNFLLLPTTVFRYSTL